MLVSYKTIGRNIRQARVQAGFTQEQTAEKLKISPLHFGRLERGERPASLEQLARIAQVLRVPIAFLLNGCILEEIFTTPTDDSMEAFSQSIAHLANCCSPKSRELMLSVCKCIAENDRMPDEDA